MLVQNSAAEIGKHGYSHWTGKPITPNAHNVELTPQSIADGWEANCSCGEWRAFASFYEIEGRDELIAALKAAHIEHVRAIEDAGYRVVKKETPVT